MGVLRRLAGKLAASGWSFTDAIELAGLGCLDGAAWWVHPIAGLAVLGAALLFVGWVMDR